ncbi:hypothetical protein [uncultured Bacteroides sp.]|uniref:hypothetical protein n=1 Tax=uncultured Bacteroides sp. TaxID=162156 RepID=UPI002AAA6458|nr:hypothetical protein [uncultured Bacteroides sp.]
MKKTIALIKWLSISAFILSLLACIVTWLRVDVYITNDTFVGLMTGFMGVSTTLIIGFQIFNFIENSNKIKKIESLQLELNTELKKAQIERKQNEYKMTSLVARAHAMSQIERQPFTAFISLFRSLKYALLSKDTEVIKKILIDIHYAYNRYISQINTSSLTDPKLTHIDDIDDDCQTSELNSSALFSLIKDEYTEVFNKIQEKIKKIKKK